MVIVLLCLFSINNTGCGGKFLYNYDEATKTLTVKGVGAMKDYESEMPAWLYEGMEAEKIVISNGITSIGINAFSRCLNVKSVVIPNSVKKIGDYAFTNSPYLTSVELGKGVKSIGAWAFTGASCLKSIVIPKSVESIGANAFAGCEKLVEVYNLSSLNIITESTDNGSIGYYAKAIHSSLDEESIVKKTNDDFLYCKGSDNKYYLLEYIGEKTDLVLPLDLEGNTYEIYQNAFYNSYTYTEEASGNGLLTSVEIPDSVTSIGKTAFYNCENITTVKIGKRVTNIDKGAFSGCKRLKNIYYEGTLEDRNSMVISSNNGELIDANWHYNK